MRTLALAHQSVMSNAWDLASFFQNATTYAKKAGGYFLIFVGCIAIIWGAYQGVKKFMEKQQGAGESWGKVAGAIIVGGGLFVGGFNLVQKVSSGGQKTITDLGGGYIDLSHFSHLFHLIG